jgi:hypothetical protein
MRSLLFISFILTGLTIFFASTGLVFEEGGFGVNLVFKPELSPQFIFGGGEEGAWARRHPNAPAPWWQKESGYIVLIESDWESGRPMWVNLYMSTPIIVMLSWLIVSAIAIWKVCRHFLQHNKGKTGGT